VKQRRVPIPREPELPPAEVLVLKPKTPPSGILIGIVKEMKQTNFCGWPPPDDNDDAA
jgi:hypothetical protein